MVKINTDVLKNVSVFQTIPQITCPTTEKQAWLPGIFSVLLTRKQTNISISLLMTNRHRVQYQDQREREKRSASVSSLLNKSICCTQTKNALTMLATDTVPASFQICLLRPWLFVWLPIEMRCVHCLLSQLLSTVHTKTQWLFKGSRKSGLIIMEEGSQCESLLGNRQRECKETSWDMSWKNRGDGSRYLGRCHEEQDLLWQQNGGTCDMHLCSSFISFVAYKPTNCLVQFYRKKVHRSINVQVVPTSAQTLNVFVTIQSHFLLHPNFNLWLLFHNDTICAFTDGEKSFSSSIFFKVSESCISIFSTVKSQRPMKVAPSLNQKMISATKSCP